MSFHKKVAISLLLGFVVTTAAPWELSAQIKSGVVNSRDQILNPTTNQQQQQIQQNNTQISPQAGKNPSPPACDSKTPKCPESPSRPPDTPGKRP
jgi:hypothetical protein